MGLFSRLRRRGRDDDERAPLLAQQAAPPPRKTPLPRMQLFVLCLMRLSERKSVGGGVDCCVRADADAWLLRQLLRSRSAPEATTKR
jgi:hypothetical protein